MTSSEHTRRFSEYDLLRVSEAAQLLRCSESTIRRAIAANEIPWFRIRPRGAIRIPAFGLAELVAPELIRTVEAATAATATEEVR
jgi:excisionase family DNA binding protein